METIMTCVKKIYRDIYIKILVAFTFNYILLLVLVII